MKLFRWILFLAMVGGLFGCQLGPREQILAVDTPQVPKMVEPAVPTPTRTAKPRPSATPLPTLAPTSSPVPLSGSILTRDNISAAVPSELKFPAAGNDFYWPGGARLLLLQETSFLQVNLEPLTIGAEIPIDAPGNHLAASPDGAHVLVQAGDGGLFVWNTADHSRQPINFGVASFGHFSPDGTMIVLGSPEKIEVTLLDAATLKVIKSLSGFEIITQGPQVYQALVSPGNDRILWQARTQIAWMDIQGGVLGPVYEYQNNVNGTAISPDGKQLVVSAGDLLQAIFTQTDGSHALDLLLKPEGSVSQAAFSPDGSLAAAGVGGKILVWESADWTKVAELGADASGIRQVGFSPDGRVLAAVDQENRLTIWRVR